MEELPLDEVVVVLGADVVVVVVTAFLVVVVVADLDSSGCLVVVGFVFSTVVVVEGF